MTQAKTMAMAQSEHTNEFQVGERVIFQCPVPEWDGLRGVITEARSGGYYSVQFENGQEWPVVWESKLAREADDPNYPRPAPPAA